MRTPKIPPGHLDTPNPMAVAPACQCFQSAFCLQQGRQTQRHLMSPNMHIQSMYYLHVWVVRVSACVQILILSYITCILKSYSYIPSMPMHHFILTMISRWMVLWVRVRSYRQRPWTCPLATCVHRLERGWCFSCIKSYQICKASTIHPIYRHTRCLMCLAGVVRGVRLCSRHPWSAH